MAIQEKPISVLIVDDSETARSLLVKVVCADPRLRLAGAVTSGEAALRQLSKLAPDAITMDLELPGIDGIETTRRIMSTRPTPIVVVSAHTQNESVARAMEALRAGALSVIAKPEIHDTEQCSVFERLLADQLIAMSGLIIVRQRFTPLRAAIVSRKTPVNEQTETQAVGIVASTGGPSALAAILSRLPPDFPLPIFIVQHIGAQFVEGFAAWLSGICPLSARIAVRGEKPVPGRIYIAPGHAHMMIADGRIHLNRGDQVDGHMPSGTVLFSSMAKYWGKGAIGVILTGMGEDGARGLAEMCEAGAWTIAQDQSTSVVYGMPAAAANLGAASEVLPLHSIPSALLRNTSYSRRTGGGDACSSTQPRPLP